jgi:hypothetical protein
VKGFSAEQVESKSFGQNKSGENLAWNLANQSIVYRRNVPPRFQTTRPVIFVNHSTSSFKEGDSTMRRPPLPVKSAFGPSLAFWGSNAPQTNPVLAFVATGTNQVTLIDPFNNAITPVALIGPPGAGQNVPVIASARPSVAAFGNWLVIAWADPNGNVNIAGSLDSKVFGDSLSLSSIRLPCAFNTGPCLGHFRNDSNQEVGLVLAWVGVGGALHYTLGVFPETRPWSPVATVSDTLADSPALATLPQNPNAAEEAQFTGWMAGTQANGALVFSEVSNYGITPAAFTGAALSEKT